MRRLGGTAAKNFRFLNQFLVHFRCLLNNFYFMQETLTTLTDNFDAISDMNAQFWRHFVSRSTHWILQNMQRLSIPLIGCIS